MAQQITQERLKELLHYDPETGVFTWNVPVARMAKPGGVAGNTNARGYRRISLLNKSYLAHRLAFLYVTGAFPEKVVDHVNGDPSDNRWSNLRPATQAQNLMNTSHRAVSGYKNVYRQTGLETWCVRFTFNGKIENFGSFKDIAVAADVARRVRISRHGEFANNK